MDRVFVSFTSIAAKAEFDETLKHLFLWYDEIIFEDLGRYDRKTFLTNHIDFEGLKFLDRNSLSETFIPVREAVKLDWDGRFLKELGRGYPRWGANLEKYDFPDPQSPEELAHNDLLRKIEGEHSVSTFHDEYEVQQVEGRARAAVESSCLWRDVNGLLPCTMYANLDEETALSSFRNFEQGPNFISPSEILRGSLPNLSLLNWGEILELKYQDSFQRLKRKIKDVGEANVGNLSAAKADFRSAEQDVCEEIIERSRPRTGRVLAEGVIGNLPMFGVNPFSIVFAWKSFSREADAEEKYDWVYMLRDIKSAIKAAEHKQE